MGADYQAGLALISQLRNEEAVDAQLFQLYGLQSSQNAFIAVMDRGQQLTATAEDWAAMHRAIDGLIALFVWDKQIFKAAVFANIQNLAYINDEGDYNLALAASRRALVLQQQSGMSGSLYIPWENIGQDLIHLGRTDEAIAALQQAAKVVEDPENPAAASIQQEIIEVQVAQGKSEEAHAILNVFLQRSERTGSRLYRGRALLAKANLAIAEAQYDQALDALHAALVAVHDDAAAADFNYEVLTRLLLVGSAAMNSASYSEAAALCARMDKEFPGMPLSISGFARDVLNHRRRLAGDFDALLREATSVIETARLANNPSGEASALLSLALDYAYVNENSQAAASLERALELLNTMPPAEANPFLRYRVMLSLANAYIEMKRTKQAAVTLDAMLHEIEALKAGSSRQKLQDLYGEAMRTKARLAVLENDPAAGRLILAGLLNPHPGSFGRNSRSSVLLQSARLERDVNHDQALAAHLYLQAIDELHKEKDLRTEVAARLQLANFLAAEAPGLPGSQSDAAEQVRLARAASSSVTFADVTWRVEFLEGLLAQNAGRNNDAISSYRRGVSELEKVRSGLSQSEQRQSFLDDKSAQELYRRLASLLTEAGQKVSAWEYIERDKARTFLEGLSGHRFAPGSSAPPSAEQAEMLSVEQQILAARVTLSSSNQSLLRAGGQQPEVVRTRLRQLESTFALLRQQAGLAQSRPNQPLSLRPIALSDVQRRVPSHTALVEYAVLDGALAAFVVSKNQIVETYWAVDTSTLDKKLRDLHIALADPNPNSALSAKLREMSVLLFDRVFAALPSGTTSLLIVPAQGLAYIPFQALFLPGGQQVIDRFSISYLPSASTLQFLQPAVSFTASPFVGALGDVSVDGLAPLPGTLIEAEDIRSIYPSIRPVIGPGFTHAVAIHALEHNDQVHFATHGLFDAGAPLFSSVLTAPSPGSAARLSLYEVMDLHLKARLVVLSACETDRGELIAGDEILGLTRTFLQAGAEDVVSSLWRVSDTSTAELMKGFYRELRAGRPPSQALRTAELAVRRRHPAPFYWAAFVNTGVR